jgi:hypothetical protein
MKDLGPLHHFLGVSITKTPNVLHLFQKQYLLDILHCVGMRDYNNPSTTPIDTKPKLSSTTGPPVADPSLYRSLAGALQYATLTRLDIAYVIQQLCLHMHDPRGPHFLLYQTHLALSQGHS